MSSIDYQHECASVSNYILINIGLEWVVWIHCHKGLWSVAANNPVPCKFSLDLSAVRIIHYSRVDIFYCLMNPERHALPLTMEFFVDYILKYILVQTFPYSIEFSIDVICIIWDFHADAVHWKYYYLIFVSPKCQQKKIGKGIRSNVYSLGIIISFACFPWQLFLLLRKYVDNVLKIGQENDESGTQ